MEKQINLNYEKVKNYLREKGLYGVILASRPYFSWFTCGAINYVNASSDVGAAFLFISLDKCICVSNNIDGKRIQQEELDKSGIEVIMSKWFDPKIETKTWKDLICDRKVVADIDVTQLGITPLPEDFVKLRFQLSPVEIARYRKVGEVSSKALEYTGKTLERGMSEFEIAGLISKYLFTNGVRPLVILVAVDDRIKKYRHPIPTEMRLEKTAQLVICAEKYGLVCSCTRLVNFGKLSNDLEIRHQAVVNVDLAFNFSTIPGRKMNEVYRIGCKAYEDNGFKKEWMLHHQGGPAGYGTRDFIVTMNMDCVVENNQAFAWNPSITGTKSEDTIIATKSGQEFLTQAFDWPVIKAKWENQFMERPDILVR